MRRLTIGGVFLLCLAAAGAQTTSPGKWVKLAPFPEPANEVEGASTGGKFYVLGGLAPGSKPRGLVYEYTPATDQWIKKKLMPVAVHHAAVFGYDGKVYTFGGFVLPPSGSPALVPIDNTWQYDPAQDSWKELAPMPSKRGGAAAILVGDKIYVIGGITLSPNARSSDAGLTVTSPQHTLGTVEEYDPLSNTWRVRSPMPTARADPAVGEVDGKIYVIGGRIGSAFMRVGSNTDVVEQYDPATDSWGPMRARMPLRVAPVHGEHLTARFMWQAGKLRMRNWQRSIARLKPMIPPQINGQSCRLWWSHDSDPLAQLSATDCTWRAERCKVASISQTNLHHSMRSRFLGNNKHRIILHAVLHCGPPISTTLRRR